MEVWALEDYKSLNVLCVLTCQARTSFHEAKMGHNNSFMWPSILAAKNVLADGLSRHIGNGEDTTIWGTSWLACRNDPHLLTDCIPELKDEKVSRLMIANKTWDLEILEDLFRPEDIPIILNTPICHEYSDSCYWKDNLRGQYMIKSGYRRLLEAILDEQHML